MTTATLAKTTTFTPSTFTRKPRYLVTKSTWSLTSDSPTLASTTAVDLAEMIELIEWDMVLEGHELVSDIKSEQNDEGPAWEYREYLRVNKVDGGMVSGREMDRIMRMAGM